ncbi:MAG TPA: DNA polymerase III subunit alpha, partial [Vicinamibacteria bacterium]|nr:DNA polymerase III subunit alpha [Vicinamibacteria bacterium]
AGVVIAPRPLTELVPLASFKGGTEGVTTQFDMHGVERVGLLKMDFLGLRTLTLIDNCVKMIAAQTGEVVDIEHVPTDDARTYELFTAGRTAGLFQFESDGMRDILKRFKPDRLEHLTALNALYRPGPMAMIDDFIKRRHGQTKVVYDHPLLEPILSGTYGVMVYQEQVMQIASALAGYTLGQADILRKAMGKKKADVMATQKDQFLRGCAARGVPDKKAQRIWDHMEQFAGYGFNKSHSAAYAWVAYQTGYLKANYPSFFMAALLTSERANTDKMVAYIAEAKGMGIEVLPPDVNESSIYFAVVPGKGDPPPIRFGMAAIKNVGEGAVEVILRSRGEGAAFKSLFDFCERVDLRAVNRRVVESFIKSGCFDSLDRRRASLFAVIDRAMELGQKRQRDREQGQSSLFGAMLTPADPGTDPAAERIPAMPDWPEAERLAFEKESLGFFITGHPLERYQEELREWATVTTGGLSGMADKEVTVGGITTALRLLKTKKGDRMATFVLEDLQGSAEVLVFPETYKKVAARLADDGVVLVKGRAETMEEGKSRLLATDVLPLDQARLADARFVTIRVPLPAWDRAKGERLRDILGAHRGECPVTLEMFRPGGVAVAVAPSTYYRVRPDAHLRDEVEALLGPGSLVLARSAATAAARD